MLDGKTYPCKGIPQEEETMLYQVTVRWWDGYLEEFAATDVRFGVDLLYLALAGDQGKKPPNRHIPLRQVRWFSVYPPTKEANRAV